LHDFYLSVLLFFDKGKRLLRPSFMESDQPWILCYVLGNTGFELQQSFPCKGNTMR